MQKVEQRENKLKEYLKKLTKEQIIELYLQKCFDIEFVRFEERFIVCEEFRDMLEQFRLSNIKSWNINKIENFVDEIEKRRNPLNSLEDNQ